MKWYQVGAKSCLTYWIWFGLVLLASWVVRWLGAGLIHLIALTTKSP